MKFNEGKLIEITKPYFTTARAGDWEHSLRVVKWVKELAKGRADLHLLVTAGHIHDIGWSGVAPKEKLDLDMMLRLERKANENSSKLVKEILEKIGFPEDEIRIVNRLVVAADKHKSAKDDEAIIVDADSLSKLCLEHLQEKYRPDSFEKVLQLWETKLQKRIKTDKGKELFPKLLVELRQKLNQSLRVS